MRIKNYAYRLMGAICAFTAVACMDESFDVSNVSTEVTLLNGTTVAPLGHLGEKTIGELLGNQEIAGLEKDENGNLSFGFSGTGDSISIEGITREFEIPAITNAFAVEYPQFEIEMEPIEIDAEEDIYVDLGVLDDYKAPDLGFDIPSFEIPDDVELPMLEGSFTRSFSEADNEGMHIDVELPTQVDNVSKIFFKSMDGEHNGAPMHLRVDFNDLAPINGGGELEIALSIAGGRFNLLNADNELIHTENDGNKYVETYIVEEDAEYIDFTIYVESITNDTPLDENHHMELPLELTYDMNFAIQAKAGNFDVEKMPHIELDAAFQYSDAELDVNSEEHLVEYHYEDASAEPIAIEGLPEQVKTVNRVSLADGGIFRLFAHGLEWMEEGLAESMEVTIDLPEYLVLHEIEHDECEYDEESHELKSTIAALDEGIEIAIDALDFGAEGISPDENGDIDLDFAIDFLVDFTEDAHVYATQLEHEGDLNIEVGVAEMLLTIESVSGCVDYEYEVAEVFELPGLGDYNIEIGGVGLKPVIEVRVTNPLTMPATLEGVITPMSDGVVIEENSLDIPAITIAAAKYADGVITPADITLIIADESLRGDYEGGKYTFVGCNVAKLLRGKLPEALDINLSLSVDDTTVQTIYMAESLSVEYGYKVDIPIAFDDSLEITYNGRMSGLNSLFEMIAGYDIKVGDVAIIAVITNTTPLQLAPQVTMIDVDGEATKAQVAVAGDACILGSSDGVTPKESTLRLELDLGEDGLVSNLADIDGIEMQLVATSAADDTSVPLKEEQSISAKLQIELAGGITIDVASLLSSNDDNQEM